MWAPRRDESMDADEAAAIAELEARVWLAHVAPAEALRRLDVTPPLGVNLFAAAAVARIPVQSMFRSLIVPVLVVFGALLLITFVPAISLWPAAHL